MQSALTTACKIKLQNFEGPFDLLFHLIEKDRINIYDIPINDITDQYMEYLFDMQELDLEVASEFLVMASTLLHIKSRMLLPEKKETKADEVDPREELVIKLVKYKKYKEFSHLLREREKTWSKNVYKLPELISFSFANHSLELSSDELVGAYTSLVKRNKRKRVKTKDKIINIVKQEKVSLKSKMKDIINVLLKRPWFRFSELFSFKNKSKTEVITGFLAMLELSKLRSVKIEQKKPFSELIIRREGENVKNVEIDNLTVSNSY